MAQILKETVRNKIVEAATNEFLQNGYDKASMRRIAKEANVTAGNLYRYFKSKEELIKEIINPALIELNQLVEMETNNNLSLFSDIHYTISFEELEQMLRRFSYGFTELIDRRYKAMMILMVDSEVRRSLVNWFVKLIKTTVKMNVSLSEQENQYIDPMCEVYAMSICAGITKFFEKYYSYRDKINIANALFVYFDGFIKMVQGANWRQLYE